MYIYIYIYHVPCTLCILYIVLYMHYIVVVRDIHIYYIHSPHQCLSCFLHIVLNYTVILLCIVSYNFDIFKTNIYIIIPKCACVCVFVHVLFENG